jgi:hypothetical protein
VRTELLTGGSKAEQYVPLDVFIDEVENRYDKTIAALNPAVGGLSSASS